MSFLSFWKTVQIRIQNNIQLIGYGIYAEKKKKSVLLYKSCDNERENVEYPRDIKFILKARYMSGIEKYFFKFQYGHIKICQKVFTNLLSFVKKVIDLSDRVLYNNDTNCFLRYPMYVVRLVKRFHEFAYRGPYNPTKLKKVLHLIAVLVNLSLEAYVWLAPYKAIIGTIFCPLYFYVSPNAFLLAFNLEPLNAVLFYGSTHVYIDLQFNARLEEFSNLSFRPNVCHSNFKSSLVVYYAVMFLCVDYYGYINFALLWFLV